MPLGAAFTVAQFIPVHSSETVQFTYYVGLAVVALIFGSFTGTAQLALIPYMAPGAKDRVGLTSIRSTIATFGQVLYAAITIPLVNLLGKGDLGTGYVIVVGIYTVIQIICYQLAAKIGKPYDLYPVAVDEAENKASADKAKPAKEKYTFATYISCLFKNKACLILFFGDFCKSLASMLYRAAASYYLTYYVGNYNLMTQFQLVANITMLVGSYLAAWFAGKFGKKLCNTIAYGGFALGLVLASFVGVGTAWGITVFIGMGRFFSGLNASLSPAMYADIGDYWELKTGKKMHAFFMMIFNLAFSVSSLFLTIILSGCLAAVGYSAAAAVTQPQLNMMLYLVTLIPGIPLAIATVVSLFYPLTDKKMEEVHIQLEAARAERLKGEA